MIILKNSDLYARSADLFRPAPPSKVEAQGSLGTK